MQAALSDADLVSQGAEAKVYRVQLHPPPAPRVCVKHRFRKTYRHPSLDAALSRARLQAEARVLVRCLRAGVSVPAVRLVDLDAGLLGTEWVDGLSVRRILGGGDEGVEEDDDEEEEEAAADVYLKQFGVTKDELMRLIGREIGRLHQADIVHGDLTTSNMMLRERVPDADAPPTLVLIDFGLAFTSTLVEDKAVDLYVLERAFASTHPDSEPLFAAVLDEYAAVLGNAWDPVRRRLEDVRLRGRKRSMVG